MPPKKLAMRSLAAKPTAIPPIPPKASRPEMDTPTLCSAMSPASIHKMTRTNLAVERTAALSVDAV